MPVNPFIAALGDVFQGLSVDRANKRKLSLEEEERRRRDEQQLLGNRMALYEAGYRPTGDMEGVLEGLQELQAQQGVIRRALTPQAIAEAASQAAPRKLQASSGYEDLSAKETDPLNLSEMVSNVQRSMQTPLRLPGVRSGEYTNYSVDPTQTRTALAATAAEKAEKGRESRQTSANDAIYKRTTEAADKAAQAALLLKIRAGKGKLAALQAGLANDHPLKHISYEALDDKVGDVSEFVDTNIKLEQGRTNDIARQSRIDVQRDGVVRGMQDRYEKANKRFDNYSILIPEMITVITARPSTEERGAADNLILTTMARLMDPTTGVREAEFRNAANSGGLWDKVRMIYDNIASGQRLTDEYRRDILRLTLRVAQVVRDASTANDTRFQQMMAQQGLNNDQLILNTPFANLDLEEIGVWAKLPEAIEARKNRDIVGGYKPLNPAGKP